MGIDSAIDVLATGKSLKETTISNNAQIADSFKRHHSSTKARWDGVIRTWLLQYYAKTLNLDIRKLLANILADNFESLGAVDWNFVLTHREFKGHTVESLLIAYNGLESCLSKRLKVRTCDLSLEQVAKYANEDFKPRNLSKNVEKRREELIDYFERMVNLKNICDFVED